MNYTSAEMMVVTAARMLKNGDRVFVGIGMPNLAVNLAKRLHAPDVHMIFEAGVIGAKPSRLPLSIGDPCLVTGAGSVCSMFDVFAFYLQRGLIDIGFLGAAQVDRFGNLNSTVIGSYERPKARLAGSGGACDIACLAKKVFVLIPHEKRRLPEKVDFITSPGFLGGRAERSSLGLEGGPDTVITNKGVLRYDETGEMILTSIHPGVTVDEVLASTGWALKVSSTLEITPEPNDEELRILREELDPTGVYLGGAVV